MKLTKFFIGFALAALAVCMAFGLFTLPKVQDSTSDKFSAERVSNDLKVISKEHHSVIHTEERDRVCQYLYDRLEEMGGNPSIYIYDSVKFRFGGYYNIGNVYCQFNPENREPSSYVLLTAHLDSRFAQVVLKDTVYSYGAADDGYGLGVILESVNLALKYRSDWKQGLRILFTDSEENELDGMKRAFAENHELFDNVGLMINVEARGVKGPALLFETSKGNAMAMDLYKASRYPYSYSLTSVVYNFLPNFTDFSVVKDYLPGFNFSAINNLNYYHTDKDCFDNINLQTIQHYGVQITPIIKEYLTNEIYSDPGYLKSDEDEVFFTVPGLNMFRFTKGQYYLFNSIVFALFCIALAFNVLAGGVKIKNVFKNALTALGVSVGLLLVGEGIAYVSSLIAGTKFDFVGTKYIKGEYAISICAISLMVIGYIWFFIKKKAKSHFFVKESMLGTMFAMVVLSAVLLFTIGENFFFIVPVAIGSIALILYLFVFLNIFSLPALMAIALLQFSFLYNILIAMTIGALGVVMFIGFFSLVLMVGLFDCYMNQKR